jgi:type IV pilus assembly protein PilB
MTLGLALAQSRRIAPALLTQLEQSAREKKSQLIDEIIASGTMTAHDVAIFAADKYQLPLIDLSQFNFGKVPPALASNREFHAHRLLPLARPSRIRRTRAASMRSGRSSTCRSRPSWSSTTS